MHEHIFVLTADIQQNYPAEWGSEEDRIADGPDDVHLESVERRELARHRQV